MTFRKKLLKAEIALAKGQFSGGGNAKTLVGYWMRAVIQVAGDVMSGVMELTIFGLPLETMNQLAMVGRYLGQRDGNTIKLYAGDANDAETDIENAKLVFSGMITGAMTDANAMPKVAFKINATPGGGYWAVAEAKPTSAKGSQDAVGLLKPLAKTMGLAFEDAGVKVKLQNPYYYGSPWSQALAICRDAGVSMVVEKGVMAVTPPGGTREGEAVLVSPATGMVGYPRFSEAQIVVTTLYNPAIRNDGKIKVESELTPACGVWRPIFQTLELECLTPKGRWFQTIQAVEIKGEAGPA